MAVHGEKVSRLIVHLATRTFSEDARAKFADSGEALPDGSFPIPDVDALRRAIQSFGRAPIARREMVRAHIKRRAKVLGRTDLIPDGWT